MWWWISGICLLNIHIIFQFLTTFFPNFHAVKTFKKSSKTVRKLKTESIRKLSNFNFEWTKTLYQNNVNNIALFFLHFSRAIEVISYLWKHQRKRMSNARKNECQISQHSDILHRKFSEFYLCFQNYCEIWHLFSQAPIRNSLGCYYR